MSRWGRIPREEACADSKCSSSQKCFEQHLVKHGKNRVGLYGAVLHSLTWLNATGLVHIDRWNWKKQPQHCPVTSCLSTVIHAIERVSNLKAAGREQGARLGRKNMSKVGDCLLAFLPISPSKLFIAIPKHTYQWRIHGDSLNTKILSIMASKASLTPSSSTTPCPWMDQDVIQLSLHLQRWSPYDTPSPLTVCTFQAPLHDAATKKCCVFKSLPASFSKFLFEIVTAPLGLHWLIAFSGMTQVCSSAQLQNRLQTFPVKNWPRRARSSGDGCEQALPPSPPPQGREQFSSFLSWKLINHQHFSPWETLAGIFRFSFLHLQSYSS